jgi:hypothetical protein
MCVFRHSYPVCNTHAQKFNLSLLYLHYFTHVLINGTIFENNFWKQNVCFDSLYKFYLKRFSFKEELTAIWSQTYIVLSVKYPIFLSQFLNELEFLRQIFFEKYTNIIIHENPSKESRVATCGQTDGLLNVTKLMAIFIKFCEKNLKFKHKHIK